MTSLVSMHLYARLKVIFIWYILSKDVEALEIIEFQFAKRNTSMKSLMMSLV